MMRNILVRVNMATMVLPPPSTKPWQNMMRTRETLAKKNQ
jgi:hypothetical protein